MYSSSNVVPIKARPVVSPDTLQADGQSSTTNRLSVVPHTNGNLLPPYLRHLGLRSVNARPVASTTLPLLILLTR